MPAAFLDPARDLLLGVHCVGCRAPGRLLCDPCAALLPVSAQVMWPRPVPAGLATPFGSASYDGLVRDLVLGHKEHGLRGLSGPLSGLLATAVSAALVEVLPGTGRDRLPVVLVPVPSRPASCRARGDDPLRRLVVGAADGLRRAGGDVTVHRLLRTKAGVVDQAGLGAAQRAANLAGSMWCPTRSLRRVLAGHPRACFVVCDDVITTGSTAREAQRALETVGLPVAAIAAIAGTRRRSTRD